jgi:predicted Zn-dependent protease with MMP-like domain
MDRTTFEELVRQTLDELPEDITRRLDNVEVVIEEAPAPTLLRSLGLDPGRDTLFGLYEGVPLNERSYDGSGCLPDKISIYYRPLVRSFRSPRRIRREVRDTIIHEVAHFFGFDDDEIEDLGY